MNLRPLATTLLLVFSLIAGCSQPMKEIDAGGAKAQTMQAPMGMPARTEA